jgi:hypothetical protein
MRRMLAEQNPEPEPFDQEALAEERHYLSLNLDQELARLEQLRRDHLAVLEALDGSGWERTGRHGEHGELTVELYETHVAAEEVDHLAQIAPLGRPKAPRPAGAGQGLSLARALESKYVDLDGYNDRIPSSADQPRGGTGRAGPGAG